MDTATEYELPTFRELRHQVPPGYASLRSSAPVVAVTTPEGPAWLVTTLAEVKKVLSDPRFGLTPPGGETAFGDSLFQDGEAHGRLRRLVTRTFTPRAVAALGPRIEQLATNCVSNLVAHGPGSDLVADVSRPLPLEVISEVLGVTVRDRARFHRWVNGAIAMVAEPDDEEEVVEFSAAWDELSAFLTELADHKRAEPTGDLFSALVEEQASGPERVSDKELVNLAATLLITGYLTTANALSVGVIELLSTGELAGLSGDESGVESAVEEVLRRQTGPGNEATARWVQQDLVFCGRQMRAGDRVLARLEAANHDPDFFHDPERFDPRRAHNPHVAFGYGPHHCIGAALARMELQAAFRVLSVRLPGLRLAVAPEDVPWMGHPWDDGPAMIQVTW